MSSKTRKGKKPQKHLDKDQLAQLEKNQKEISRKRTLITEKFYPALITATVSVDEAKALINAMGTLLMEDVLRRMKEIQFADISGSLLEKLCADGERQKEVSALLQTLHGENLFTAREMIEGMTRAIEAMITTEMRERKLDTLQTQWDKFLN